MSELDEYRAVQTQAGWRVMREGGLLVYEFTGAGADQRARDYAAWSNRQCEHFSNSGNPK